MFLLFLLPAIKADTTFFDDPNSVFIINGTSVATPGGIIGRTIGAVTDAAVGGGCLYRWNCTDWGECLPAGIQTRNCANVGTCPNTYNSPKLIQNCTYVSPEIGKEAPREEFNPTNKADNILLMIIVIIILFMLFCLNKSPIKKLIKKIKHKIKNKS